MKKLTILFFTVCFIAAVGCQNDVTPIEMTKSSYPRVTVEEAMLSIEEAGGTVNNSAESIKAFLEDGIYWGTYNNHTGFAGTDIGRVYKGKIYTVVVNQWTEIDTSKIIGVDKDLGKLEMSGDGSANKIFTFDGFGYYIYENGENDIPTYFTKYGFVENYVGTHTSEDGKAIISISANGYVGCQISGMGWDAITDKTQLRGKVLTIKGTPFDQHGNVYKVVFDNNNKATWYKSGNKF